LVLGEVGFGVNESLEIEDGETGWEVKVKELLVEGMVGCDDRYGDSRPGQNKRRKSVSFVAVAQDGSDSETTGR